MAKLSKNSLHLGGEIIKAVTKDPQSTWQLAEKIAKMRNVEATGMERNKWAVFYVQVWRNLNRLAGEGRINKKKQKVGQYFTTWWSK